LALMQTPKSYTAARIADEQDENKITVKSDMSWQWR